MKKDKIAHQKIGHLIKLYRKMKGKTQHEIAKALGVSNQQLQKYENGIDRVSALNLKIIADELSLPLSAFLENSNLNVNSNIQGITEEDCSLLFIFNSISNPHLKESLKEFIEKIASIKAL